MEAPKAGRGSKLVFALLVVSIVVVAGTVAASYHSPSTTNSSTSTTDALISSSSGEETNSTTPNDGCGYYGSPGYIVSLVQQVEPNAKFLASGHNLEYVFEYYDENGPTTGNSGGVSYYAPPFTELVFYSFGNSTALCDNRVTTNTSGSVVGALWIHVPKNGDGSYDLANMTGYFTPGLFLNQTAA